jgi:hypothetical protein
MSRRLDQTDDKTSEGLQPSLDWVTGYREGVRAWRMRFDAFIAWLATQLGSTFAAATHSHPADQINNSSSVGRAVVTAADEAAARTAIGAEASLGNRTVLLKIGEDGEGNPTWNGGPWPGASGSQTELVLEHPSNGTRIRFFVNDSNNADWEVLPPPP